MHGPAIAISRMDHPAEHTANEPLGRDADFRHGVRQTEGPHPDSTPGHILDLADNETGGPHESRTHGGTVHPHNVHDQSHTELDDLGHLGTHHNDELVLENAHPHAEHSVGYTDGVTDPHDTRITNYENHGFMAMHVNHHTRDKNPEHHPHKGRMEHAAEDVTPHTQQVF